VGTGFTVGTGGLGVLDHREYRATVPLRLRATGIQGHRPTDGHVPLSTVLPGHRQAELLIACLLA